MVLSSELLSERLRAAPRRPIARGPSTGVAAVAAVLRNLEDPEILFIKRAEHPRDPWSGQMALPGGRQAPMDEDCRATAVRETREEVGIDLGAHAIHLGALGDVQASFRARSIDLVIVPHVFVLEAEVTAEPDPSEVELAVWAPLGPMLRGESRTSFSYRHEGEELRFPAWRVGEHVVWGLTHRMLDALFEVLRP